MSAAAPLQRRPSDATPVRPREVVKTALCVEVRDGQALRLPAAARPARGLHLALVAAIEQTAAAARHPGARRGLPAAARSAPQGCFAITPDPGVIEVNIHPSATWGELVETTADRSTRKRGSARLGTEKFMLDGRHTGTGGGNHVTLGGAHRGRQPDAAPPRRAAQPHHLLAEPSGAVVPVLRHVHRADQPGAARGRSAQRHPLRARDRVRAAGRAVAARRRSAKPWLVDRLLRNLLVDLTGNTHRAEFSHRQAVLARQRHAAGSGCSSSAPSRCRRTRA